MMVPSPIPVSNQDGGTGPSSPSYIRPVLRRVESDFFPSTTWDEIFSSTSKTKADLIAIAQAGAPGIPTNAFGLEYFIVAPGGPGFSGSGFGGLPGATVRGIIPFDLIPDGGSVNFEVGAPGIGLVGGQGYSGGMSSITLSDYSIEIIAEGGLSGAGSQADQRAQNLWIDMNNITISDIGQVRWPNMISVGPSSPNGPGGGAPNAYDPDQYPPYGGYGARTADAMYACGDGGEPGSLLEDYAGAAGFTPGGGGGASGPSHPGGSGGDAVTRYAIIYWEPVNE